MKLEIGNLYKIIKITYLYKDIVDKIYGTDCIAVIDTRPYFEKLFLYLGKIEHGEANNGYFHKFLYENMIYFTEDDEKYNCIFEEVTEEEE